MTMLSIAIAVLLLAAPPAEAQQAERVYRIGLLGLSSRPDIPGLAVLRHTLRDLGYEEGKNLIVEYRWAEGQYDRLKTAKLLGLTVPTSLLLRAGQVIE